MVLASAKANTLHPRKERLAQAALPAARRSFLSIEFGRHGLDAVGIQESRCDLAAFQHSTQCLMVSPSAAESDTVPPCVGPIYPAGGGCELWVGKQWEVGEQDRVILRSSPSVLAVRI